MDKTRALREDTQHQGSLAVPSWTDGGKGPRGLPRGPPRSLWSPSSLSHATSWGDGWGTPLTDGIAVMRGSSQFPKPPTCLAAMALGL